MSDEPDRTGPAPGPADGAQAVDPVLEERWRRIEEEMRSARYWLSKQGSIVLKKHRGRHHWVLRFRAVLRGRRLQGTIYIGGEEDRELLRRAEDLLLEFRAEAEVLRSLASFARLAARAERRARRAGRSGWDDEGEYGGEPI